MNVKNIMPKLYLGLLAFIVVLTLIITISGILKDGGHNTIEGVIAEVKFIEEGTGFFKADIRRTIIRFEDGRVKSFLGISDGVFQKGKLNVINYVRWDNRYDTITSVTIK